MLTCKKIRPNHINSFLIIIIIIIFYFKPFNHFWVTHNLVNVRIKLEINKK